MSYKTIQDIPTSQSKDMVWLNWYKDLRKTLGVKKANSIFGLAWSAQNAGESDANTSKLRLEMEGYGIEIDGDILGTFADFRKKTAGYFGDMFTFYKWISIGLGSVFAISLGVFVYQLATKPKVRKEAIDAGATLATRGLNKAVK